MRVLGRILMLALMVFASANVHADVIAYFPLDGDGNDVFDFAHPATVGPGITFGAAGQHGGAASFTGQGGIQLPHDPVRNPDSSFTLTAWVNPTDTTAWNSVVTSREDSGTVNGYILYNSPENQWDFWTGAGGAPGAWGRNIGPTAVLDQWTHLAISYDKSTDTKTLYVNAIAEAVVAGQGYATNGTGGSPRPFNIGAGQDLGDGFFFNGLIDDIIMFDQALSAEEVACFATNSISCIPEPTSFGLLLLGGLTLLGLRRRI